MVRTGDPIATIDGQIKQHLKEWQPYLTNARKSYILELV